MCMKAFKNTKFQSDRYLLYFIPILSGGDVLRLLKDITEIVRVSIANFVADLLRFQICGFKEFFGFVHSDSCEKFYEGFSGFFLKDRAEVVGAYIDAGSYLIKRYILVAVMVIDIASCAVYQRTVS